MLESVVSQGGSDGRDLHLRAFRYMLLARTLDEKLASLYRAGKIPGGGVYLGKGQEALSVSLGIHLRKGDVYAPLIRDGAGRLAFGETPLEAVRTCLGSPLGPMRSRDGNVHRGRPKDGYLPMISHLGAMISVVNGALMAKRYKGQRDMVGAAVIGDGATSTGASHEALNQAAVEKLPLVLMVADNQYAYSTPTSRQFACKSLVDRALGYGIRGWTVDGTDLAKCLDTIGQAVQEARSGGGPQLVVGCLLRLCGHGEHDDASYIDPLLKQAPFGRDALDVARTDLLTRGWVTQATLDQWHRQLAEEVDAAVAQAQRDPLPEAAAEKWNPLATSHLMDGQFEVSA
ncbi:MAG TPA: thiamine pyrophosphate-dependent dehydrogenase E1 component subunit alpha [Methylomirabilota bacterium]|nr:thiamine pyrophosphate-dependent dehydrogenase E1 component subunit alpha [Methylomirabilota bacterium]